MHLLAHPGAVSPALTIGKVFTDGGHPDITYIPREDAHSEEAIRDHTRDVRKFLSLTGPTKVGKSVLIKRALPYDHVLIDGGSVESTEEFFDRLRDELGLAKSHGRRHTYEAGGKFELPGVVEIGGQHERETDEEFEPSSKSLSVKKLLESGRVLVIDDFHLVPPSVRTNILRTFKNPVAQGVKVILVSVPHRGFDAVRSEPELNGRVEQHELTPWTSNDLDQIALRGFAALNVDCSADLRARLVANSYCNPNMMQMLCRYLCRVNGVKDSTTAPGKNLTLEDEATFFRGVAKNALAPADLILILQARERRQRRQMYQLRSGDQKDIYILTLMAIAEVLPQTVISGSELFRRAQSKLKRPQALFLNQITSALSRMSTVAQERPGEKVIEWDSQTSELVIIDPTLAFLIKWTT